jgi:hypothetical protein
MKTIEITTNEQWINDGDFIYISLKDIDNR